MVLGMSRGEGLKGQSSLRICQETRDSGPGGATKGPEEVGLVTCYPFQA